MKEVILTIGRHGLPDINSGIVNLSMLDAYFSAKKLKTFGKALILCSPLQRAMLTAKIRQEVMKADLTIMEKLSQSYFSGLSAAEEQKCAILLRNEIFAFSGSGSYVHLHILTHMPVMDILHFPVCDECEYITVKAPNWPVMKEMLESDKIPYERGDSGRRDSLNFISDADYIDYKNVDDFLAYMKKNNF